MVRDDNSPDSRTAYGFARTVCGCAVCQAPCRHIPGSLDVADLTQLCPLGQDLIVWAEEHLRAIVDKGFPTLVPARRDDGHCHWLYEGRCLVHEVSPFSCAFFDSHMTEAEIERRSAATIRARKEDALSKGLYYRVWFHLRRKNLVAPSGDRDALAREVACLRRQSS
jgi:hypothetical protein